ncbi:MAG TPA: TrbI/VirB10 family protein [Thermoanaerobaculia bacterium]|nr:TrbI/VirB10 family protein [Thermoanaerobaculia bacterium]
MPTDPLATPPSPQVERLNRSVLLVAALIVMGTLLVVAFLVSPRPPSHPTQQAQPNLAAGAPGFLNRPPGSLPPAPRPPQTEQDYLRSLLEQAQPPEPQPTQPLPASPGSNPLQQQPSLSSSSPAPTTPPAPPRDARHEEFLRALRAPLAEPLPPPPLPGRPADLGTFHLPSEMPAPAPGLQGDLWPSDKTQPTPSEPNLPPSRPAPVSLPLPPQAALALAPQPRREAPTAEGAPAHEAAPSSVFHPPAASSTVAAGTLIPALLETEVNSDLPGPLLAQVSRDVYDFRQQSVLVPRGTRLLGRYDNQVAVGQQRMLVAWTRLTFPDGSGFDLPGLPTSDAGGAAGLSAHVESHLLRLFGDALLLSLLSAGADLSQPQNRNLSLAPSAGSVASAAVGQELANVGLQLLRRDLSIQPTLRLAAGTPFVVFVNGDLPLNRRSRGRRP